VAPSIRRQHPASIPSEMAIRPEHVDQSARLAGCAALLCCARVPWYRQYDCVLRDKFRPAIYDLASLVLCRSSVLGACASPFAATYNGPLLYILYWRNFRRRYLVCLQGSRTKETSFFIVVVCSIAADNADLSNTMYDVTARMPPLERYFQTVPVSPVHLLTGIYR
jgi:hypothetical protein